MNLYGIEESTDSRSPCTKVKRFTVLSYARRWQSEKDGELSFSGAARKDIPLSSQNWHHTFRYVYEMPKGFSFRLAPVKKFMAEQGKYPVYGRYPGPDRLKATAIRYFGEQVSTKEM